MVNTGLKIATVVIWGICKKPSNTDQMSYLIFPLNYKYSMSEM